MKNIRIKNEKLFCCLLVFIVYAFVMSAIIMNVSTWRLFITENKTAVNTAVVTSYTIVDKNSKSHTYYKEDDKFNEISNILSSVEIKRDKSEIYLYDDKEQIILNSKNKSIKFYQLYDDNDEYQAVTLIIKDFCEDKDTPYLLDYHDYLVAKISKNEYNKIFNNQTDA